MTGGQRRDDASERGQPARTIRRLASWSHFRWWGVALDSKYQPKGTFLRYHRLLGRVTQQYTGEA